MLQFPRGTACWCYQPPFISGTGAMENKSLKKRKPAQICAPGKGEALVKVHDLDPLLRAPTSSDVRSGQ